MATLCAAILVLLTALNLVLNLIGSSGPSMEEAAAMVGVGVFLLIANLANKERVIPELMSTVGRSDVESFDALTTMTNGAAQTEVNPTTASIITSILGEQATTDQQQVNSAIDTLSLENLVLLFVEPWKRSRRPIKPPMTNVKLFPQTKKQGKPWNESWSNPFLSPGVRTSQRSTRQVFLDLNPTVSLSLQGVASVPLPTLESGTPTTPSGSLVRLWTNQRRCPLSRSPIYPTH